MILWTFRCAHEIVKAVNTISPHATSLRRGTKMSFLSCLMSVILLIRYGGLGSVLVLSPCAITETGSLAPQVYVQERTFQHYSWIYYKKGFTHWWNFVSPPL